MSSDKCSYRCARYRGAAGFDPTIRCTCGAVTFGVPDARGSMIEAALAWARADRLADERQADLNAVERAIAATRPPVPAALIADRDAAVIALREANAPTGDLENAFKEAARDLLNATCDSTEKKTP